MTQNQTGHTKNNTELIEIATSEIENSKKLQSECDKYNIKFIDTSFDRTNKLNEIVDYVIASIKD